MLELQKISKKFGNKTVIDQLSLKIPDDSILTIVGPSGAGKTTLLRCIIGLDEVDGGKFLLDGKPFDPYVSRNSDGIIGAVFQDFQLFPNLSVEENITLAPMQVLKKSVDEAKQDAKRIMEQLHLLDYQDQYPYQLSGGQKQRVAISRALAMRPQILCYDEPTSALDPELKNEVKKIILDLKKTKITQIVITHDIDFANDIADQTLTVKPVK
ncbi:ATP-binding cassette domain-containing protein [Pediococcus argentinicus]|uniref:amino acid ABC transporter ATP-binding protein n=1 Tax=Pediococcus argentinicus TaxID=480391 RepID=UPI00338DA95A